jgi:hypothetical protein
VNAKVFENRKSTALVGLGTTVAVLGFALMPAQSSVQPGGTPTIAGSTGTGSAVPGLKLAELKWSDVIGGLTALGGIVGFSLAVLTYRSSEKWKRSEFVAAQINESHSDMINESVIRMMDYDPALIDLFPNKPNEARYVKVSLATLVNSISKEDFGESQEEFQIRQYFEHFLLSLSRLNYFMNSGAIKPRELCADFRYIVSLMDGTGKKMKEKNTGVDITDFSNAVKNYLSRWRDNDIEDFMQKISDSCKSRS